MADRYSYDYDDNPYNDNGRPWMNKHRKDANRNDRWDNMDDRRRTDNDRGFFDRAADEVASWFGDDEAERRRQMDSRYDNNYRADDNSRWDRENRNRYRTDNYDNSYNTRNESRRENWRRGSSYSDVYDRNNYGRNYYDRDNDSSYQSGNWGSEYSRGGMYSDPFNTTQTTPNSRHDFPGQKSYFNQHFGTGSMSGLHSGKGPKGYKRSDERIREDVCEYLLNHGEIDATDIDVTVENGEVTLSGNVTSRYEKHLAEDLADNVSGVADIHNRLRVGSSNTTGTVDGDGSVTTSTTGTRSANGRSTKSSTLPS